MDNYFWIKWKENIIGILMRINQTYYAKFQTKHLANKEINENIENIIRQTSFMPDKLYQDKELFDFFKRRLRVEPNEDVFDRIRKTGAKRPTDNFWLDEMSEENKKQFEKVIKEIKEISNREFKTGRNIK